MSWIILAAAMLDLNHPFTKHIFAASRFEDAIKDGARRIIAAPPAERAGLLAGCEQQLDAMRALNREHFKNSPFIASAIDELQQALRNLAASASPQINTILPALVKLESGDGFGTFAI